MKTIQITDPIKSTSFIWYNNSDDVILREFQGFEYASTNNSFQDLSSRLGAYYSASKFSTRRLSITGDLVGDSIFTNRRLMLAPLSQDGIKLMTFTTYDDLELQCEVVIDKIVFPYTHSIHTFLIEMIAPDWRFYSQIETTETIDQNTTDNEVVNAGDEDTFPIITLNGPFTKFEVLNNNNGQTFTYEESVLTGQAIVIDCKERTVLNVVTNKFQYFDGDFMMLESGTNLIDSTVTGGDANSTLEIKFRSAYRGI